MFPSPHGRSRKSPAGVTGTGVRVHRRPRAPPSGGGKHVVRDDAAGPVRRHRTLAGARRRPAARGSCAPPPRSGHGVTSGNGAPGSRSPRPRRCSHRPPPATHGSRAPLVRPGVRAFLSPRRAPRRSARASVSSRPPGGAPPGACLARRTPKISRLEIPRRRSIHCAAIACGRQTARNGMQDATLRTTRPISRPRARSASALASPSCPSAGGSVFRWAAPAPHRHVADERPRQCEEHHRLQRHAPDRAGRAQECAGGRSRERDGDHHRQRRAPDRVRQARERFQAHRSHRAATRPGAAAATRRGSAEALPGGAAPPPRAP